MVSTTDFESVSLSSNLNETTIALLAQLDKAVVF